jgi:hypothetical protein
MNTIRTIVAIVTFLIASLTVVGQSRYEYATLSYEIGAKAIMISIDGKTVDVVPLSKSEQSMSRDLNPALQHISKMDDEGWELFSTSSHSKGLNNLSEVYTFYLRRPKQQ